MSQTLHPHFTEDETETLRGYYLLKITEFENS